MYSVERGLSAGSVMHTAFFVSQLIPDTICLVQKTSYVLNHPANPARRSWVRFLPGSWSFFWPQMRISADQNIYQNHENSFLKVCPHHPITNHPLEGLSTSHWRPVLYISWPIHLSQLTFSTRSLDSHFGALWCWNNWCCHSALGKEKKNKKKKQEHEKDGMQSKHANSK